MLLRRSRHGSEGLVPEPMRADHEILVALPVPPPRQLLAPVMQQAHTSLAQHAPTSAASLQSRTDVSHAGKSRLLNTFRFAPKGPCTVSLAWLPKSTSTLFCSYRSKRAHTRCTNRLCTALGKALVGAFMRREPHPGTNLWLVINHLVRLSLSATADASAVLSARDWRYLPRWKKRSECTRTTGRTFPNSSTLPLAFSHYTLLHECLEAPWLTGQLQLVS